MKDIDVIELKEKLDRGDDFLFLDVREPHEFQEFNLNAQLVPLGALAVRLHEFDEFKDKEIVVHCRSGARSASAKAFMTKAGFEKVRNLLGGVLSWREHFPNS